MPLRTFGTNHGQPVVGWVKRSVTHRFQGSYVGLRCASRILPGLALGLILLGSTARGQQYMPSSSQPYQVPQFAQTPQPPYAPVYTDLQGQPIPPKPSAPGVGA